MKNHQKHTNLIRKENGIFAPNEIAILGVKCSVIAALVYQVTQKLPNYKLAYFDASHAPSLTSEKESKNLSEYVFHQDGNVKIQTFSEINKYKQRLQFSQYDCIFINGNHYQGIKQIVFLDAEKEASINKRIHQISDIVFFVKTDKNMEPFQELKKKFPNWQEIPSYTLEEIEKITNHIEELLEKSTPNINGLVLIGGQSTRMGTDKSELNYHGKSQKEYVKELLESNNISTYYSVRNSLEKVEKTLQIEDTFLNLGPFGGICSAFQKDPNSAWFVLATDLPFVTEEVIQLLLKSRNPSKIATAVKGKSKEFVEPLIAIFEPKAYPILLQFLAQGYSCPRKVLINSDVEIVEVDDALIRNINTPKEFELAQKEINVK